MAGLAKNAEGEAALPKYRQIANALKERIDAGRYAVGDMLPPEADLCEEFQTSRFTVREALRNLADVGLVDRRRGSGTRVISLKHSNAFVYRLSSTAEILKYPAETYRENMFTGMIHADPDIADKIDCPIGKAWYRISGVRRTFESDLPISWSDIYVLPEFSGIFDVGENGRVPVYEQIAEKANVHIADAEVRIFASAIEGRLADLLRVPVGSPALSILRRYLDESGRNFETTLTIHPEKRFEYSMHLRRETPGRE